MKTKKELAELSNAIGEAIGAYHNAIANNLKESGKEHEVEGDDENGLHLTIIGRHDSAVDICVDKIRYNCKSSIGFVEVHICEEDYKEKDYWLDIDNLGDDADYVNDNIVWDC